jgi:hypothetical protein
LPVVNQVPVQERLVWSFWAAAAVAFVGGLLPLVFGGTSSRMVNVIVPFTIGAAALAVCGFVYQQGRLVSAVLYFVAGLAIVYGVLAMFAIPLELTVLGTCNPSPATCLGGIGRPLTAGENTGMGFAAGFGLVALFVGFLGLMIVFRKPVLPPAPAPPVRNIPPVKTREPEREAPASVAAEAEREEPELPAPEELPELPAHESEESHLYS